ncbi:hypothetical protein [Tateyamaria pelophila]|uniref:hypothetical protein n=1 Tax=Tateyamaria pelophila TaxID=328415 RepID=UPI001CC14F5D|nr:hypothetical protein [Tateyamaria pelophila]
MLRILVVLALLLAKPVVAQDRAFVLQAPATLVETGFLKHLLPRFSLKTGIRISVSAQTGDARLGDDGTPVFQQGDTVWRFASSGDADANVFEAWLLSDVGKRTIEAYAPNGNALFSSDVTETVVIATVASSGDLALGEETSLTQCGRCHVVNETNRMNAIGSTPSFALMRTFPDWQARFETFFMLRPHAAFTQVIDVTEPFPEHLPSPIVPIEVTVEEVEAITAYVGSIAPANLGSPIQIQ